MSDTEFDNEFMDDITNKQPNVQGDKLVQQAEKRLKAISFFNPTKHEDAIDLLDKAAAQYKATKNWLEAAQCFVRCAEICEKSTDIIFDACNYYVNAGKMYRHFELSSSIKMFEIAVQMHQEQHRFSAAAKLYKEIAQCYERLSNLREAMKMWKKAADCYEAEDSTTNANLCLQRVAELFVENQEYQKAIQLYEKISKTSLERNVGKWTAKDYLYKALMCTFVLLAKQNQLDLFQQKLDQYKDLLPSLDGSRECKFVEECMLAYMDDDLERFSTVVFAYNQIYKLDDFSTRVLFEIKQLLRNGGNMDENDEQDLC